MMNKKNKLIAGVLAAAMLCGCLASCNSKPKHYRFVKVMTGGREEVENIDAVNDTDAVKQYMDRMEKIIVANLDKADPDIERMYIISPAGDTLNTDEALMESVLKPVAAPSD